MRDFMNMVSVLFEATDEEADPKVSTKSKDKFDFLRDLDIETKSMAKTKTKTSDGGPTDVKAALGKKASGASTRDKASRAPMSADGAEAIASMVSSGMKDSMSDDDAAIHAGLKIPVTNNNLPAIVNKEIALAGGKIAPEWHQIKHLPGYMISAIRAGGREVFLQFTTTPIEEIQMISTFMDSDREVKAVMNWIKKNGKQYDSAEMTFAKNIKADVRLWKVDSFSFLLVRDFMGEYVYAWANSGDATKKIKSSSLKQIG